MKQKFTFLLLLIAFVSKGQTSVYHPFPDSNAVWNFRLQYLCWFPNAMAIQDYSIALTGDTLINSQTYHKLSTPFVQTNFNCLTGAGMLAGYQGAIRQDTAMKKVFYIPPTDSVEQLLYDFNMQVGDTVQGFLENIANPVDTVMSIDSVLVGNNYRKRWILNTCYNISLIEGVGSVYGLIMQSFGCMTADGGDFTLLCFKQDNTPLYPSNATSCELITSLPICTSAGGNKIEVYPNPFVDNLYFEFENQFTGTITLSDITGRNIMHENFNGKNYIANCNEIVPGVYTLEFRNSSGELIHTKKLVKQ